MRTILLALLVMTGLSALVSGLLMINYPDGTILGVPPQLIRSSPFNDLVVPGLLLVAVSIVYLLALYHYMDNTDEVYNWTLAAGVVTCGWLLVQYVLVQQVLWMQFVYLFIGIMIILISLQLKHKWLA